MAITTRTTIARTKKTVHNKATKTAAVLPKRGRGRPPVSENGLLDRKLIIACAYAMSRDIPLQELSIVRVAKELGVTPALIHYYLNGREALTSGVMNAFYCELVQDWPQMTGDWLVDVEAVVRKVYEAHVSYPGIAAYVVANNRFRLKQITEKGEKDYGVILFERCVASVREAGFDSFRTAMWSHLLIEFIVSMAFAAVRHSFPGEHGDHLDRIFAEQNPTEFPAMAFIRKDYVRLNASEAFTEALRLILTGITLEQPVSTKKPRQVPASSGSKSTKR